MIEDKFLNEKEEPLVETPKAILDATVEKLTHLLKEYFPDYLSFGNGTYTIMRGSTQVMVIVRSFTNVDCVVECTAHVVTGAEIDDELMRFLLRKNAELHFGSFALLFDDTISFSYSLAGRNLDPNEFITAMNSVAMISDYYDDIIVNMAGGKRALDVAGEYDHV